MFIFTDRFDQMTHGAMTLRITEKNPAGPDGLPFYFYDILVDGVPVGKISIRIGETFHTYYNGNIGYEIDAPHRGHGYARAACRMVLDVARHHGMTALYLACAESNAASYRTIEGAGRVPCGNPRRPSGILRLAGGHGAPADLPACNTELTFTKEAP